MNQSATRSLFTYLFLVGLPLAGLLGVLRAGRGLQAPPPVDGTWQTVAASPGAAALTPLVPPSAHPAQLEVHQSGTYLSVDVGPHHMSGRLRGDSLVAHSGATGARRGAAGCGGAGAMELHAWLDVDAEPDRLTVVLSEPGRPACPQMRWTAVHLAAAPAAKGGH